MNIYNDGIFLLLVYSFLSGAFLGVFYDVLYCVFDFKSKKSSAVINFLKNLNVFLRDIVFCVSAGFFALVLMYNVNKGVFRGSVYILMLSGFLLYRVTLSHLVRKLLLFIVTILNKIFSFLFYPIYRVFRFFYLTIRKIICIIVCRRNLRKVKKQKALVPYNDTN